jgi:putative ABC transport system ATP-binding protein
MGLSGPAALAMAVEAMERPLSGTVVAIHLEKEYSRGRTLVRAIDGIDLAVREGEFVSVMGPSGSGKSTLLHLLGGLERPSAGAVMIGDLDLHRLPRDEAARFRRRHIGFVFQFFNLVPTLTAAENVALPLLLEGRRYASVRDRVEPLLVTLGLEDRADHAPSELSGGEMQRVAIARALVVEPRLVLADEPTGNLDSASGAAILELLRRACDERGVTIVLVTHDPRAASYADRVVILKDGRVEIDVPAARLARRDA